ncbi:hypothetical protein FHR83_006743 [Actinoplanes campanulatus]|uniref:Uncharacterized protein n=1 Tax=Actinoplanes campanulatus TaxID=113559 RepID=A0A7W5AMY8_9ACTN|nr:hypothetical protein [Actinoplanes campanulatus]
MKRMPRRASPRVPFIVLTVMVIGFVYVIALVA